jgi:hypothetical protein
MPTLVVGGLIEGELVTGGLGVGTSGSGGGGGWSLVVGGLLDGPLVTGGLGATADEPGPEPELPTDDFWTALRKRLRAEPTLADLTNVFNPVTPTRPVYPFLVITHIDPDVTEWNTSDSRILDRTAQFTILATVRDDARRLAAAAHASLLWDADGPILFAEGYEMARFPTEPPAPREQPGVGPGGLDVFLARFEVSFMIGSR